MKQRFSCVILMSECKEMTSQEETLPWLDRLVKSEGQAVCYRNLGCHVRIPGLSLGYCALQIQLLTINLEGSDCCLAAYLLQQHFWKVNLWMEESLSLCIFRCVYLCVRFSCFVPVFDCMPFKKQINITTTTKTVGTCILPQQ